MANQFISIIVGLLLATVTITNIHAEMMTSTTPVPDQYNCSGHSDSCDDCVKSSVHCYFCYKTKRCGVYPFASLKPFPSDCSDSLSDLAWRTCVIPMNVLVIVFCSLAGLLVFIIFVFLIWCCLIRPCVRRCNERDNDKWQRNRLRLEEIQSTRRQQRQQQRDVIKAKYGLDGPKYEKFWMQKHTRTHNKIIR